MKAFIPTLAAFSISGLVLLAGCSMNRADSLRMLDRRADYDAAIDGGDRTAIPDLKEGGLDGFRNAPVPVRTRAQVAPIWIFPHETASRDYFWGGWISVVTEEPQWVLTKPKSLPVASSIVDVVNLGGKKKKPAPTHSK